MKTCIIEYITVLSNIYLILFKTCCIQVISKSKGKLFYLFQLHEGEKPVTMVDGWNAWFYDDFDNLVNACSFLSFFVYIKIMINEKKTKLVFNSSK